MESGTALTGKGKTMDIREIDGLWCDDITFCQEDCYDLSCPRNSRNIRDKSVPHSYSVDIPGDCPRVERAVKKLNEKMIRKEDP